MKKSQLLLASGALLCAIPLHGHAQSSEQNRKQNQPSVSPSAQDTSSKRAYPENGERMLHKGNAGKDGMHNMHDRHMQRPSGSDQGQDSETGKSSAAQTDSGTESPNHLKGTVMDSRHVQVGNRKGSAENRVVLLKTQDGQTIAVDLGPEAKLKSVRVKQGTPVEVRGSVVSIDGDPVFLAQEVQIGDKSINTGRAAPDERRRPRVQSFSGTIDRTKELEIEGSDNKHEVAILKSGDENQKMLVDLGPVQQLDKLNIEQGDKVRVQGIAMNINHRRVLVAENVRKNGKSLHITRDALPENVSLKQGSTQ